MSKIRIGIDINETIRAKWLQFDKYYVEEFGESGVPTEQDPYVYDFFNTYKWCDTQEVIKELKEPDDMPENINPLDYVVDKKTGESPADFALFKKPEINNLTAKEVYNKFMYEDFVFEIHATAPPIYRGADLDLNVFYRKYSDNAEFIIQSVENPFSIPSTLFFLSKITSRIQNYRFVEKAVDMWKDIDVLITTDPLILSIGVPWGKKLIKINRPYNQKYNEFSMESNELINLYNNTMFEKIIKYKK